MENSNPSPITIKDVFDIIFRNKKIIVITFILGIIVTLIGLQFVTHEYEAEVKMLIRGQGITAADTYAPIGSYGIQSTQAEIVKSNPVLRRAAIALKLDKRPLDYETKYCSELNKLLIYYFAKRTEKKLSKFTPEMQEQVRLQMAVDSLKNKLSVSLVPNTNIFIIKVTGYTKEEAIETANVISRSYTIFDQLQQLAEIRLRYGEYHPTVLQLKDNIFSATNNLSGKHLTDIEAIGTASVKIIEQATASQYPIGKPKSVILAIAIILAMFAGFGLAFLYGYIDHTIKLPQEIPAHLGIPCIGTIPKKKRREPYLITDASPLTRYYEYYEDLAEQLYVFLKTQKLKSALLTSPLFNENHKYIVPNLGYFLSKVMGHTTLLVDSNAHNPHFQNIYKLQNRHAPDTDEMLPDDKKSQHKKMPASVSQYTSPNLLQQTTYGPDILLAGTLIEKSSGNSKKIDFASILDKAKKEYDIILIDATSINNVKDITSISGCSDGVVIIIDEGKLQRQMIKNSLPRLKKNDTKIIGTILHNRTFPIPDFIYRRFKYLID